LDIQPVGLGQGTRLTRFDRRRDARQRNHRRSQKREYRQGGKRFDHFGPLIGLVDDPAAFGDRLTTTSMTEGSPAATFIRSQGFAQNALNTGNTDSSARS